jgi:uncharacterized membrane protein
MTLAALDFFSKEGIHWFFRWWHVVFGVAWIGLLYYFNFVQVPSFPTMEAPHRNGAIDKLVPQALWYFRFAALATAATGIVMLGLYTGGDTAAYSFGADAGGTGHAIYMGAIIGLLMLANVWPCSCNGRPQGTARQPHQRDLLHPHVDVHDRRLTLLRR